MKENDVLYFISSVQGGNGPKTIMKEIVKNSSKNYTIVTLDDNEKLDYEQYEKEFNIGIKLKKKGGFNDIYKLFLLIKRFYFIVKKSKPKVIIADGCKLIFLLVGIINILFFLNFKKTKIKIIFRYGNVYSKARQSVDFKSKLLNFLEKLSHKYTPSLIIFPSFFSRDDFKNEVGISNQKTKVIYNPVDIKLIRKEAREKIDHSFFNENDSRKVFVTVASLTYRKGIDYLIEAFTDVVKSHDIKLAIIGEGDRRSEIQKLINENGLNENVKLFGYQKNPYKFINKSYALIHPALWEGFGIVILEAMACGVPVIATKCPGGPKEIIKNNKTGILVKPKSSESLKIAIIKLIQNQQLRDKFAHYSKKEVGKYNTKKITNKYQIEINKLIKKRTK
ncbi:MAG: glycosyltransferase [Halanaerobiales bacterium]|nr:glycosyltransferase [Halanaerobiales bacterium]